MTQANQFNEKKHISTTQQQIDDEQVEKTLRFFDSILEEYLTDQNATDDDTVDKSYEHIRFTTATLPHDNKPHAQHVSSGCMKAGPSQSFSDDLMSVHTQHADHFHEIRKRFDQAAFAENVRRFTSENNLHQISSSKKPVREAMTAYPKAPHTTTTSTDNIAVPSSRNALAQEYRSVLLDKSNYIPLNGVSASLIDLSSIDKLLPKPRFRFVPPSHENLILNEENPLTEPVVHSNNYDQYLLKTIASDPLISNDESRYFHKIVKPIVIVPAAPTSIPKPRLTEASIHHENGNSAFRPHQSSKQVLSSKVQTSSPAVIRRQTEQMYQSNIHVGITNPQVPTGDAGVQSRPKQPTMNYSPRGTPDNKNHRSMYIPQRIEQIKSEELIKTPPTKKSNGYRQNPYRNSNQEAIAKWIQQVNHMNGITHSSQVLRGEEYRQQKSNHPLYAHLDHISGNPQAIHGSYHVYYPQGYANPINNHKLVPHTAPVQSVYVSTPSRPRRSAFLSSSSSSSPPSSSNVYHFHPTHASRDGQQRRNPHRKSAVVTSYL